MVIANQCVWLPLCVFDSSCLTVSPSANSSSSIRPWKKPKRLRLLIRQESRESNLAFFSIPFSHLCHSLTREASEDVIGHTLINKPVKVSLKIQCCTAVVSYCRTGNQVCAVIKFVLVFSCERSSVSAPVHWNIK